MKRKQIAAIITAMTIVLGITACGAGNVRAEQDTVHRKIKRHLPATRHMDISMWHVEIVASRVRQRTRMGRNIIPVMHRSAW